MAERWLPRKVYGLDINPRVIKVAWINLYLNALSDDGLPVLDHEGKTLQDRVKFHVSDLLTYSREQKLTLDLIVGCIPQGFVEDQFGLGLVARAAEEDIFNHQTHREAHIQYWRSALPSCDKAAIQQTWVSYQQTMAN